MTQAQRLDRAITKVVRARNCSGCGACTLLDSGLTMKLDEAGFSRPVRDPSRTTETRPDAATTFASICPGRRVVSPRPTGATMHPTLGPVISSWEAWAANPAIRHRGSSGGVLTALIGWLTETGEVHRFVGAAAESAKPSRTTAVEITSREQAFAAAGSRYAPVSVLSQPGLRSSPTAVVGKPCEVSPMRALAATQHDAPADEPLLLSFFCAGTPSQQATDQLLRKLGADPGQPLRDMWYRGRGWPGRFTAEKADGTTVSTSYDDSWGKALGPTVQWRCKICPDGIGESSDLSAADFWRSDEHGYPSFTEADGCSALLARTQRGQDVVTRAFAAGVIVGRPLDLDALAKVQPLQVSRRTTLLGRLAGTIVAGKPIPRYQGFGLARLSLRHARQTFRIAKGSFRRVRAQRRTTS